MRIGYLPELMLGQRSRVTVAAAAALIEVAAAAQLVALWEWSPPADRPEWWAHKAAAGWIVLAYSPSRCGGPRELDYWRPEELPRGRAPLAFCSPATAAAARARAERLVVVMPPPLRQSCGRFGERQAGTQAP